MAKDEAVSKGLKRGYDGGRIFKTSFTTTATSRLRTKKEENKIAKDTLQSQLL